MGDHWITDKLSSEDLSRIDDTYNVWRDGKENWNSPGFCKSASLEEIRRHGHVLTSDRYVGTEFQEINGEPFGKRMTRLTTQ